MTMFVEQPRALTRFVNNCQQRKCKGIGLKIEGKNKVLLTLFILFCQSKFTKINVLKKKYF